MGVVEVVTPVAERARHWQLAGDRRAGSYSRGIARRRQYAYLRRSWGWFGGAFAVMVAALAGAAYFMPGSFAKGLLLGGGLVGVLMALWNQVVYATGTAPAMMGDLGEQWTAQELRKLTGKGWRLVNHVILKQRDIDHVLVGPAGVFAVETKWTATPWEWGPVDPRIVAAARTAREHAHDLTLWHDLKSLGIGEGHPVVFLWGQGAAGIPADAEVDGVRIVTGKSAAPWRASLSHDGLTADQIREAWSALDKQCQVRDPREAEAAPVPSSPREWAISAVLAVVAACAAALAASAVATVGAPWPVWPIWWGVLLAIGVLATRRRPLRLAGIGSLIGVIATLAYCAVVLIASYL